MELMKIGKVQPAVIEYDKSQIESQIAEHITFIKNEIDKSVTVDDFKGLRAKINKAIKEVNSRALAIDKELSEPIKDFRAFIKDQMALFQPFIDKCNEEEDKVKEHEQEKKQTAISKIDGYDMFVEYGRVFNPKWLNKTYALKDIEIEITDTLEQLKKDIEIIERTAKHHNIEPFKYIEQLKRRDVNDVIDEIYRATQSTTETVKVDESEKKGTFTLKLTATKTQREALKTFMNKNNIEWEVLK